MKKKFKLDNSITDAWFMVKMLMASTRNISKKKKAGYINSLTPMSDQHWISLQYPYNNKQTSDED